MQTETAKPSRWVTLATFLTTNPLNPLKPPGRATFASEVALQQPPVERDRVALHRRLAARHLGRELAVVARADPPHHHAQHRHHVRERAHGVPSPGLRARSIVSGCIWISVVLEL